jgi:hypothetical protein
MTSSVLFRSATFAVAMVLAIYAGANSFAETTRPALRTADFFSNGPRSAALDDPLTAIAAQISLNGDVLADYATVKTEQATETHAASPVDQAVANQAAERALISALTVSPIRSTTWLMLSTLRGKINEPTAGPLKMSYLTGSIPLDAAFSRIQTVTTTVTDEDIRLLAQSDVRSILTRLPRLDSGLVSVYVQATPAGKRFLLDATQVINPKFYSLLRQY